jgi:hypothetical protein
VQEEAMDSHIRITLPEWNHRGVVEQVAKLLDRPVVIVTWDVKSLTIKSNEAPFSGKDVVRVQKDLGFTAEMLYEPI